MVKRFSVSAVKAVVSGTVQGVGFRPFIYRLAMEFQYSGWVKNIGSGVEIHLETKGKTDFQDFFSAFQKNKPPLAQIEELSIIPAKFLNLKDFRIRASKQGDSFVFISPDIALCANCLREMNNPSDRRYEYPFINCTDCGPRYTIVKTLPYDRNQTTMSDFRMCEKCCAEYTEPLDRRYHAQPIACPVCGPHISFLNARTGKEIKGGIPSASDMIKKGRILAVKGLGGFHLVCDAFNAEAVQALRRIKERKTKPLALMAQNIRIIQQYAHISKSEKELLLSAQRPIVLLRKKKDIPGIAPHLSEMGFMLPYTPLHYLLLKEHQLLVATSSNKKDSPIMKETEEGIHDFCSSVLTHNRPIHMRADDSVLKVVRDEPLFVRRARGYVPYPQKVPKGISGTHQVLALGGELKDTISIYKNGYVVTSQFLGDLDEYQNLQYFHETIEHLQTLFDLKPDAVVSDLHPDFHSTRYAEKLRLPHFRVQHHFAHVLAPLLEHGISPQQKVLGVAFDGFGYGDDGTAWGGEFLIADYESYTRFATFKPVPLPGADLAAKQPWRMAVSYLFKAFGTQTPLLEPLKKVRPNSIKGLKEMMAKNINSPLSSSCGRLFDAVSFLTGLAPSEIDYEAEAPMRLEASASPRVLSSYPFLINDESSLWEIEFAPTIRSIVKDILRNVPVSSIAARFHNTLVRVITAVAMEARKSTGIKDVVLTGGVFLNKRLLEAAQKHLETEGFNTLRPVKYSPNDESVSVGQTAFALNKLRNG